ncbi:MAG: hypothetical protein IJW21_00905 [Clostridia bacterium]|nr:hypothetical protein [Clostridia bacterium]
MILNFGCFSVDIDAERTARFYRERAKSTSEWCECRGCTNFDKAVMKAPKAALEFLETLGIDPRKPAEACDAADEMFDDGTIYYWGFYHVCGKIVECPACWRDEAPETEKTADLQRASMYRPDGTEEFEFAFTDNVHLLEEGFPEPCIQLEFDMYLPCVLPGLYDEKTALKRQK